MENFADPEIGVVSGGLVFRSGVGEGTATATGLGVYWFYEKLIRKAEARFASVPGATGALYAMRKDLFAPISPATLLDDVAIPKAGMNTCNLKMETGKSSVNMP